MDGTTSGTAYAGVPSRHRTRMRLLGSGIAAVVVCGGIVATNASAATSAPEPMASDVAGLRVVAPTARITDAAHVVVPARTSKVTASKPKPAAAPRTVAASRAAVRHPAKGTVAYSQWYARRAMAATYGWGAEEHACLVKMWTKESEWKTNSDDHDGGYTWGIPQARPGSKMASAGADWRTNPETQIRWGLGYVKSTYGSPCAAWSFWQDHRWY